MLEGARRHAIILTQVEFGNLPNPELFGGHVPRFFFHLHDDMTVIDEEGVDLPSLQAAHERAYAEARQMACAELLKGHLSLNHRIEVADEAGTVLVAVEFRDIVEVEG